MTRHVHADDDRHADPAASSDLVDSISGATIASSGTNISEAAETYGEAHQVVGFENYSPPVKVKIVSRVRETVGGGHWMTAEYYVRSPAADASLDAGSIEWWSEVETNPDGADVHALLLDWMVENAHDLAHDAYHQLTDD